VALLGALSLFLSAIDYLLPKPLPFMRLGLANLSLLLALSVPAVRGELAERSGRPLFPLRSYCLLVLLKVLGQAFITGTFFSYVFLFSLAGSACSAAVMYGLRRLFGVHISLAGISVAGAFASNGAQLVLARSFLFGESAVYLAPPFLAAGIVSGAALGIFADSFAAGSRFLQTIACRPPRTPAAETALYPPDRRPADRRHKAQVKPRPVPKGFRLPLFFAGLAAAVVFLLVSQLVVKAALFFLFLLLAILTGKKIRLPVTAAVMAGIVACNLFPPFGRIIVTAGPFTVALGSLESGLRKALNLEGLIMLSKLVVPVKLKLPGAFGKLLAETFQILERLDEYRGLFTGSANKNRPDDANKKAVNKNRADNPAQKKRFMERLDLLLLELSADR
jgi:heptaprenyl diphosphate synthase